MAITLTNVPSGEAQSILLVNGYSATTPVNSLVHVVIGSGVPDFTIKPAQPRTGTFSLLCANETTAMALLNFLQAPGPFTLADTATAMANTTFFVTGNLGFDKQEGLRECIVSVDYTEVS